MVNKHKEVEKMSRGDTKQEFYNRLVLTLDELVKHYRSLLVVVRKEKEILISADLDLLNDNNKTKEELILKIKALDSQRVRQAGDLASVLGLTTEDVKLKDLAYYFDGKEGEKLRSIKTVLELLIKRVSDLNQFNEELVKSALSSITGAMKSIKETLSEKTTYKKKGSSSSPTTTRSGQLVRREV